MSAAHEGLTPRVVPIAIDPAFTTIYNREFSYVWHSLRRLGVRADDLADVTHDVFATLWRRFSDLDPTRATRPWLFGTAVRIAMAYRRRAFRWHERLLGGDFLDPPDPSPGAEDRLADARQQALVRESLGALDLKRRAVLIMHDFDGQPGHEIAAALGIPLKTMYSRLAAARSRFLKAYRRAERKTPRRQA